MAGLYGNDDIPWFNGGLFKKISVLALSVMEMTELRNAAALNWSAIDVSIFGTLFERGLDPGKRSQLGAHYTDPATIMRIVEPVLQRPLLQIWELLAPVLKGLLAKSTKKGDKNYKAAQVKFIGWLDQLKNYRVLDPACGSGNFLFMGLKTLKDIELKSHVEAATMGLEREADLVTGPHNMLGIELNEYAAELARVTVWIGELQWRLLHGYEFKTNPVLEPLDHIECRDALLMFGASGAAPVEAEWPKASVVIGNPPYLGDKRMRGELGDEYTNTLRNVYRGRVPGGADLICFWFEKAGVAINVGALIAAGFVATNVVARGANRKVLDQIITTTKIFDVWEDQPWVNEGANLRVSMVCFGSSPQKAIFNGEEVTQIYSDLTAQKIGTSDVDLTIFKPLLENASATYFGLCLAGTFKVSSSLAARWLRQSTKPPFTFKQRRSQTNLQRFRYHGPMVW
jgi:type II restriction/modification system DNA methylase subunit YeeA